MGMPITVVIEDLGVNDETFKKVFAYFQSVDDRFSTYKPTSEITQINQGKIKPDAFSSDMIEVFALSEQTKQETDGYFNIWRNGRCDPSGLVKGWAILKAAKLMSRGSCNVPFAGS